ncbi:MAG: preprotein translocase subunit YajC [Planctomycetes bacterium]|jgi:preprotein translocase subunit YajC|nr:preprotein translocase subunit YajC [Planctomycetota bacterium]
MDYTWILAQAGAPEAPSSIRSEPVEGGGQSGTQAPGSPNAAPSDTPSRPSSLPMTLLMMLMVFAVMYLIVFRGPRKQQQQQRQMIQSLKKNDRVRTIGGIYGTVMDVKGDEVVLKIDEATNTKIHVSASAIGKNLSQEKQG